MIPYRSTRTCRAKARLPGIRTIAPYVGMAVPFMVGDSFQGRRIVGTSPQMFGCRRRRQARHRREIPVPQRQELRAGRRAGFCAAEVRGRHRQRHRRQLHLISTIDKLTPKGKREARRRLPRHARHARPPTKSPTSTSRAGTSSASSSPPTPPTTACCSPVHQPLRDRRARGRHDRPGADEGEHRPVAIPAGPARRGARQARHRPEEGARIGEEEVQDASLPPPRAGAGADRTWTN